MSFFKDLVHGITPKERKRLDEENARKKQRYADMAAFEARLQESAFAEQLVSKVIEWLRSAGYCYEHWHGVRVTVSRKSVELCQWTWGSEGADYKETFNYKELGYCDLLDYEAEAFAGYLRDKIKESAELDKKQKHKLFVEGYSLKEETKEMLVYDSVKGRDFHEWITYYSFRVGGFKQNVEKPEETVKLKSW